MTSSSTYRLHANHQDLSIWAVCAIAFVFIVLAIGLRLLGIDAQPLWYDELYSAAFAIQTIPDIVTSVRAHDPHPSLFYILLHFWMKFGTDDVWLRLNSVSWSLLAILPTFLVGRRLFGTYGGFWAAFILTISPIAIFFAQEVRMYAMLMSLVAFNLLFLERLLVGDQRRFDLFWFFLTLLAVCYVQGAGCLLLLPVTVYIAQRVGWNWRSGIGRKLAVAVFAVAVLALPWVIQAQGTSLDHLRIWSFEDIPAVLLNILLGPDVQTSSDFVLMIFLFACCVAFVGLIKAPRTRALTISYILVNFGAILILAFFVTPLWHINALAGVLPVLTIIAGGALASAFEGFHRTPRVGLMLTGVVALTFIPFAIVVNGKNDAFRQMHYNTAAHLLQKTLPGDTIEIEDWRDLWTLTWYLSGPGTAPVDTEQHVITMTNGRELTKMADNSLSAPGVWRVIRNATWREAHEANRQEPDGTQHFARFVISRQK